MQDIEALVEMALRAPRTQAETLWLQALLQRLDAMRRDQAPGEGQEKAATG